MLTVRHYTARSNPLIDHVSDKFRKTEFAERKYLKMKMLMLQNVM